MGCESSAFRKSEPCTLQPLESRKEESNGCADWSVLRRGSPLAAREPVQLMDMSEVIRGSQVATKSSGPEEGL